MEYRQASKLFGPEEAETRLMTASDAAKSVHEPCDSTGQPEIDHDAAACAQGYAEGRRQQFETKKGHAV
jgi:hypothetical protein